MVAASKLRRAQERIVNARALRRADAARARQRRRARRPVDSPAARPCASRGPDSQTLAHRRHRRQGPVRQLQHERHQGRRRLHRREQPSPARSASSAARAATSSAAAASSVLFEQVGIFQKLRFEDARGDRADGDRGVHRRARSTAWCCVYNEFKSVMTQRVVVDQLLPIARVGASTSVRRRAGETARADRLPVRAVAAGDFQPAAAALRRGAGVSRAARVERGVLRRADDGDGHRDEELRRHDRSLTLYMNKVRQAAITREIIEVVSGAEAL